MSNAQANYKEMLERWFDHSQQRAMERYGLLYDEKLQKQIHTDVGNLVFNELLKIPDSSRSVYRGRICDQVVTFIYCKRHKTVISFLHNNWVSTDTDEFYVLSSHHKSSSKNSKKKKLNKGGHLRIHGTNKVRKQKAPRKITDYLSSDAWEA